MYQNVKIKKNSENAKLPTRGSVYAAGYDVYACINNDTKSIWLQPGETKIISTGISMEIPDGYFLGLYARSGLATKQGLRLANSVRNHRRGL